MEKEKHLNSRYGDLQEQSLQILTISYNLYLPGTQMTQGLVVLNQNKNLPHSGLCMTSGTSWRVVQRDCGLREPESSNNIGQTKIFKHTVILQEKDLIYSKRSCIITLPAPGASAYYNDRDLGPLANPHSS